MRLLFLTPYLPSPPVYGGQRRIHGLMTRLAERHDVSVVSLNFEPEAGPHAVEETQRYCEHVVVVNESWHRMDGRKKRVMQLVSLLSRGSWERLLYRRRSLQQAVDAHLRDHSYDAIIVEFAFMAHYRFKPKPGAKRPLLILDEHNVEYDILKRTASATTLARKLFHATNWRKLRNEEVRTWRTFDGVALASARDQGLVREEVPSVRTAVVPNGVDIQGFAPRDVAVEPLTLLFFGAMNYYPNTDAALFFGLEVMPLLVAKHPKVRLRIVGDVGESPVRDLAGPNIEIVGFVDDVRAEIAKAHVVIAPLRIGGGTRLKILEAMSMAKAIVATRIGAEGIDVTHEHDILLADKPHELAAAVARALEDDVLNEKLGAEARKTAVARYSWEAAAEKLEGLLLSLPTPA